MSTFRFERLEAAGIFTASKSQGAQMKRATLCLRHDVTPTWMPALTHRTPWSCNALTSLSGLHRRTCSLGAEEGRAAASPRRKQLSLRMRGLLER